MEFCDLDKKRDRLTVHSLQWAAIFSLTSRFPTRLIHWLRSGLKTGHWALKAKTIGGIGIAFLMFYS